MLLLLYLRIAFRVSLTSDTPSIWLRWCTYRCLVHFLLIRPCGLFLFFYFSPGRFNGNIFFLYSLSRGFRLWPIWMCKTKVPKIFVCRRLVFKKSLGDFEPTHLPNKTTRVESRIGPFVIIKQYFAVNGNKNHWVAATQNAFLPIRKAHGGSKCPGRYLSSIGST